ncbi:MAG TPA: radical SAM family heme chaperone HemW [Anaerolineales bacterium]|nr:radical SAM family heme chaperone HemW [Anaerolineae bacterium]HIQ01268.1 radical SAM family heme chaperone HemW [Anaerolineales bacterium]
MTTAEAAAYVHVPFCRARCAYCDFNTYAGIDHLIPAYGDALRAELRAAPHARARTLYFGGGTPSILPLDLLAELFHVLRLTLHIPSDAEVTLEANPGTVPPAYLRGLRELGVNRLSLGAQSIHEDELRLLGRIHTWAETAEAVEAARAAGFDNLNLDFIYGLPGQTLARWQETLEAALRLGPEHLSLYALTLEEGTPLKSRIARGELRPPDEDLAAEMVELAEEVLADAGYFHYEISNWARLEAQSPKPRAKRWWEPGAWNLKPEAFSEDISPFVCRHNLTYWRNEPYLGFGAGAASWREGRRWTNVRHPADYIARLEAGRSPAEEVEEIPPRLEMGEMMMMGLRLAEGVSDGRFRARFGQGLEEVFGEELARLQDLELLEWDGRAARLTPRGRLLGNQVFRCFLP